jgi:hypothetical protein
MGVLCEQEMHPCQEWSNLLSTKSYFHYLTSDSRRFERGKRKKRPMICHHFACVIIGLSYVGVWGHETTVFFFNVPLNPKHHWSDYVGRVMAECLHKHVFNKMWKDVASSKYLTLSCDEVTTIDNQSWISIHCYVVQDWCRLHVLIFFKACH